MTLALRLVIQDENGKVLGMIDAIARGKDKPFSSGSAGYYASGKVSLPSVVDGEGNLIRSAVAWWRSAQRENFRRRRHRVSAKFAAGMGCIYL